MLVFGGQLVEDAAIDACASLLFCQTAILILQQPPGMRTVLRVSWGSALHLRSKANRTARGMHDALLGPAAGVDQVCEHAEPVPCAHTQYGCLSEVAGHCDAPRDNPLELLRSPSCRVEDVAVGLCRRPDLLERQAALTLHIVPAALSNCCSELSAALDPASKGHEACNTPSGGCKMRHNALLSTPPMPLGTQASSTLPVAGISERTCPLCGYVQPQVPFGASKSAVRNRLPGRAARTEGRAHLLKNSSNFCGT